jgi:hypothetical protein
MNDFKMSQNWRFWFLQIVPPTAWLVMLVGTWNIGTTMLLGIPLIFSIFSILFHIVKRKFEVLLRPILTVSFGLAIIIMGNYYANQSKLYVKTLAESMQVQCNRDGYCKQPPGNWKQAEYSEETYYEQTAGLVPFRIVLTFDAMTASNNSPSSSERKGAAVNHVLPAAVSKKHTAFRLIRKMEDFDYQVYGGVGLPLSIVEDEG